MAFTQAQLEALQEAYAAGVLTVHHGDKTVTYASMADLWAAIQRIQLALTSRSSRYTRGVVRFRDRFGSGGA